MARPDVAETVFEFLVVFRFCFGLTLQIHVGGNDRCSVEARQTVLASRRAFVLDVGCRDRCSPHVPHATAWIVAQGLFHDIFG